MGTLGGRKAGRASSLRSGRRDKRKNRELGGQTMRAKTSDSNYNISTAAQLSGKNERNDEAGLKRVWWARASREREKGQENGGVAAT